MKKFLVFPVAIIIAIMAASCGGDRIEGVAGKIEVKIERSVKGEFDPYLTFSAESASLSYDQRTIEINGIISIRGDQDFLHRPDWVVPELEVKDSKIIIPIPKDANYHIFIGEQYHLLPKIVEVKK